MCEDTILKRHLSKVDVNQHLGGSSCFIFMIDVCCLLHTAETVLK